jgi:hypothetical protein
VDRAWYLPSGHIVYVRSDGAVFAAPFDVESRTLGSQAVPLFEGVRTAVARADMVLGQDGTVLFVRGNSGPGGGDTEYLTWVNRDGTFEAVDPAWAPDDLDAPSLSPDGGRVALGVWNEVGEIWVKELPDGPLTRISDPGKPAMSPARWTPDGRSVVYRRGNDGTSEIVKIRADGSQGEPEVLFRSSVSLGLPSLTPDGEGFVYVTWNRPRDIGFADGSSDSINFVLEREFNETGPALSPDGRWLAYASDVTGDQEVFVRPFPNVGDSRVQVSVGGGSEVVWARDGSELFYRSGPMLMAAEVGTDPAFEVVERTELFEMGRDYISRPGAVSYDVSPDAQRFLMVRNLEAPGPEEEERPEATLILIENWFTELARFLGEGN